VKQYSLYSLPPPPIKILENGKHLRIMKVLVKQKSPPLPSKVENERFEDLVVKHYTK
jgi:hypothetical protein